LAFFRIPPTVDAACNGLFTLSQRVRGRRHDHLARLKIYGVNLVECIARLVVDLHVLCFVHPKIQGWNSFQQKWTVVGIEGDLGGKAATTKIH
jgi:hypothetical protein